MSLGIRERIIATYRAEIESHELNDRNFATVKAQIADLERRREAFQMSVTALKQDFEAQLHSQETVIASLTSERDSLAQMNDEKAKEAVEVSEQVQGVKAEICQKDVEIRELNQTIQATISENQSIERECDSLKQGINEQ